MKTKPIIKNFLTRAAMTLLMLLTAATAWAGQKPITNLDVCRGEAYSIYVRGWAFDPDARDWGLDVEVYVYTDAACQNEYTYKKLATGDARSDVVTVHSLPSGSKPGFEGRIPIKDPGTYYVKVYAIDIDQWGGNVANSSTEMSNSFNPVTVTTLTTIGSAAEWNTFVNAIKTGAEDFTGKTVKLTADIPTAAEIAAGTTAVTTITGEEKAFCGTFDGQGHTINVDLNVSGNEAAGLFSYVKGATIKNLTVTGTINNTGLYVGGLVGTAKGATIQNCTFAATINSSGDEVGAFVGGCNQIDANTPGNLTLQDCVFSGSIHYTGSFSCKAAGLVNVWNNTSLTIRNCLVSGSFTSERSGSQFYPIAFKTADATVTANVSATYYLNTLPVTTSGENVIAGAEGLPVIANETEEYDVPVPAADGHTYYYYLPHTTVTSSTTEWTDGLYAVTNDVTISSRITVNGTVILFLGEGVTLNARWGIGVGSGNTLTIEGSGTLQSGDTTGNASIGGTSDSAFGHIIINSGTIIASGSAFGAAIGGGYKNSVSDNSIIEINGGVVTATGGQYGAGIGGGCEGKTGVIIINGGQVTARGGQDASGIGRGKHSTDTSGSLTIGWTHESDFIDVDSYAIGSISFAEGKKFIIDGEEILATVENIGGKKIIPLVANNWPSPIDLTVINFTDKTAKLTWTAPETTNAITGYAYQYKDVNESTWSDEVTTTETTVTISGLTVRTDYAFRVKALYGSDASGFELLNFTTAPSLPYEQGFEDGMDGWKEIENDPQGYGTIQAGLKHEGNNSYKFMFYSGSSGNQYLISPNLGGATGLRVSFYHLADNICDQFQIGYSTSTDDITAFTWGDVATSSLGWNFHTENLPDGTKYVAVKAFSTAGSNSSIYFDDFIFKDANIKEPVNLAVDEVSESSATLTWEAPETPYAIMGYDYQYKKASDSDWTSGSTTDTSVTIDGLSADTDYLFRVKALYDREESIVVSLNFNTAPSLPYEQGFENGKDGWKVIDIYPQGHGIIQNGLKHEGNNCFEFKFYSGNSGNQYLISPNFGGVTTGLRVSFYHRSYNYNQFQIGYSTSTDDITAFTWGDVTTGSLSWEYHTENLPKGTKYVAVKAFSTAEDISTIYFDDFIFINPNIKEPVNLAVDEVSENSATLTWETPETSLVITGYDYQYKKASDSDWTSGSTTATSVTIDGLSADTDYLFRVKALYDREESIFVSLNFTTAISLPYEQGFENGMAHWVKFCDWAYTGISESAKYSGENGFVFVKEQGDQYLISPRLSGTDPVVVTFAVRTVDGNRETFWVGYSTTDMFHFSYRKNITLQDTEWHQYIGEFPADTRYIVIQYLSTNDGLYIDDIVIKEKTYDITLADNADNAAVINDYKGKCVNATLQDRTLYRDGDWNTLTVPFAVSDFTGTPLEGATVKTLSSSAFSNGTLTLNFEDATSIEAGKPYIVKWDEGLNLTINSTAEWNAFAESVNGGKSYAGKTVLLGADIDVSTMVGTGEYPFSGTFEGAGHSLNVSISDGGNGAAPFRYISGATIRNVKTSGSVNGGNYSAGLVGFASGGTNRIRDCYVTATVNTSGSYIGGILGNGTTSTTTISNCMFSGYLTAANMGILYGWGEEGGTHTVENCVASGTYADLSIIIDEGEGRSIDLLLGNGTKTVINCWKNKDVISQGDNSTYIYTGGTHPLIYNYLGSQWTYENNNFVLSPTVNIVGTNIVNPVFEGVTVSNAVSNVETTWVDFVGTYEPLSFSDADPSILFLGTESTLYYPLSGAYIGAQRAFFRLKGIAAGDTHNQARAFVLNFGDSETTGILSTTNLTNYTNSDAWYDLSGRRLNGKPTQKGLYINNGRKVVIK